MMMHFDAKNHPVRRTSISMFGPGWCACLVVLAVGCGGGTVPGGTGGTGGDGANGGTPGGTGGDSGACISGAATPTNLEIDFFTDSAPLTLAPIDGRSGAWFVDSDGSTPTIVETTAEMRFDGEITFTGNVDGTYATAGFAFVSADCPYDGSNRMGIFLRSDADVSYEIRVATGATLASGNHFSLPVDAGLTNTDDYTWPIYTAGVGALDPTDLRFVEFRVTTPGPFRISIIAVAFSN